MKLIIQIALILIVSSTFSQQISLDKVGLSDVSYNEIIATIKNKSYSDFKYGVSENTINCDDGIQRYYYTYVPDTYKPENKTPLLLFLHGGVTMNEPGSKMNTNFSKSKFRELADNTGCILLVPVGDYKAPWWNYHGITMIMDEIKRVKEEYNIDHNKIFLSGVSDGASGAFLISMLKTEIFAGFICMIGHPVVGSIESGIQAHIFNLFNTSLKIINTTDDKLYPSKRIEPIINSLKQANGHIEFKEYSNYGHDMNFFAEESPFLEGYISTHTRNPLKKSIKWETAYPEFGKYLWIAIDKIDARKREAGHTDLNYFDSTSMYTLDFIPGIIDNKGVKVLKILDRPVFSKHFGIQSGDVINKINNTEIHKIEDIISVLKKIEPGEKVKLGFFRNESYFTSTKKMYEFSAPPAYSRELESGQVIADYNKNTFTIKTSGIGKISIFINPEMVDLNEKIKIIIDEKLFYDDYIIPDKEFIIQNYRDNMDNENLFVKKLSFKL